jgi:hypothetical protein
LNHVVRQGTTFAITIAIAYSVCTLVFWAWPQAAASFMNGLFHGLDFTRLQTPPGSFGFELFVYGVIVLTIWAVALGALFGWISGRLGGNRGLAR